MRVYINNLDLSVINSIDDIFKEHLVHTEKYIKLYTDEGIYNIGDKQIHFLEQHDKNIKIYEKFYKDFSLIVDPSYFNKYDTSSIHGETHLSFEVTKKYFKLSKQSNIQMIIKYHTQNAKLVPNDLYFQSNKEVDINDILFKKEIIEFLSALN